MTFDEFKKILENKSIEIPEKNLEFFYEFTTLTTDKVLDEWINQKYNNTKHE